MLGRTRFIVIPDVLSIDNKYFGERGKPRYMDEKYFLGKIYATASRSRRLRTKPRKCILPTCRAQAVESHTLPEAVGLRRIALDGKVAYPHFNFESGSYGMRTITTSRASVFIGFCAEHEQIFQPFERSSDLGDPSVHFQNFRAVSRDLFNLRITLELFKDEMFKYKNELYSYTAKLWKQQMPSHLRLGSVGDEITKHMEQSIAKLEKQIHLLEETFFEPYVQELSDPTADLMTTVPLALPFALPVVLAGRSDIIVPQGGKLLTMYLSMLPSNKRTILLFSAPSAKDSIVLGVLRPCKNALSMLSFIEQWMVVGTDYWYMNPLEWESYPGDKKARILNDLRKVDSSPPSLLQYGIFDSVRRSILKSVRTDLKNRYAQQLVEHEASKLDYVFSGPA